MLKVFFLLASFATMLTEAKHHKGWGWGKKHGHSHGTGWGNKGNKSWDNDDSVEASAAPEPEPCVKGTDAEAVYDLLKGAIHRGVPLYNSGYHEACAMIYETALHALLLKGDWGLTESETETLESGYADAQAMTSHSSKAWAYRHLMDALIMPRKNAGVVATAAPESESSSSEERTKMLFAFKKPRDLASWDVILDGVMGGESTGFVEGKGGNLIFSGETSLENNGGFSSIRAGIAQGTLEGMNTLRLRVRGDGREYILSTRADDQYGYWTRFQTEDKKWMTVDVPIREMEKHWYGFPRTGSIEPSQVRAIELYIYDKKAGPFKLKVDSIEALA